VTRTVADALGAARYRINAPAILGPGASSSQLEHANPQIREALAAARSADLYLLGMGSLAGDDIFVRTGLISARELETVRAAGGIGDLCGNFYDASGCDLPEPFADRIVGIALDDLRRASLAIACAGGQEKVPAMAGALQGRLINGLVTDEHTARSVLGVVGDGATRAVTAEPRKGGG
jgi:DNA-binding transcriptional regulator LsrR (DeoR family)